MAPDPLPDGYVAGGPWDDERAGVQRNFEHVERELLKLDQAIDAIPPPGGGGGSDAHFVQTLGTNSTWTITHNLGKKPAVTFLDSSMRDITSGVEITHLSVSQLTIVSGINIATPTVALN